MHIRKALLWIIPIFSAILLMQGKMNDSPSAIQLNHKELQDHTWVLSKTNGDSNNEGHRSRKLLFKPNHRFVIIEKFEFSGSTFSIPGIYDLRDSTITLYSFNGETHIGTLRAKDSYRLCIKWIRPEAVKAAGLQSETYRMKSAPPKPKRKTFTSRVFQVFHD